ncbi:unnamed protein product [Discosporangium mesarthrocarpum]
MPTSGDYTMRAPPRRRKEDREEPIFLRKTYEMINTCNPKYACWSRRGDTFTVKDPEAFAENEIPKFFKHNKFSSFVRQLNFYGFRKVKSNISVEETDSKWWEFKHDLFQRGKDNLLADIKRATHYGVTAEKQEVEHLRSEVTSLRTHISDMDSKIGYLTSMVEKLMVNTNKATLRNPAATPTDPVHNSRAPFATPSKKRRLGASAPGLQSPGDIPFQGTPNNPVSGNSFVSPAIPGEEFLRYNSLPCTGVRAGAGATAAGATAAGATAAGATAAGGGGGILHSRLLHCKVKSEILSTVSDAHERAPPVSLVGPLWCSTNAPAPECAAGAGAGAGLPHMAATGLASPRSPVPSYLNLDSTTTSAVNLWDSGEFPSGFADQFLSFDSSTPAAAAAVAVTAGSAVTPPPPSAPVATRPSSMQICGSSDDGGSRGDGGSRSDGGRDGTGGGSASPGSPSRGLSIAAGSHCAGAGRPDAVSDSEGDNDGSSHDSGDESSLVEVGKVDEEEQASTSSQEGRGGFQFDLRGVEAGEGIRPLATATLPAVRGPLGMPKNLPEPPPPLAAVPMQVQGSGVQGEHHHHHHRKQQQPNQLVELQLSLDSMNPESKTKLAEGLNTLMQNPTFLSALVGQASVPKGVAVAEGNTDGTAAGAGARAGAGAQEATQGSPEGGSMEGAGAVGAGDGGGCSNGSMEAPLSSGCSNTSLPPLEKIPASETVCG